MNQSRSGNGIIDCYPLEKILIFTQETFQKLKIELAAYELSQKPKTKKEFKVKRGIIPTVSATPREIWHAFEPSRISHAYDGDYWRWQRVAEWFKEYAQDYE